jgi:hypothetical protein
MNRRLQFCSPPSILFYEQVLIKRLQEVESNYRAALLVLHAFRFIGLADQM